MPLPYSILGTYQIFPSISQHLTSLTSLTAILQFPGCQRHPYPPHVPWCTSQQPRKCRDPFAVGAWLAPLALGASKSLQPFQPSWPWHLGDAWEPQECLGWAKVIVCVRLSGDHMSMWVRYLFIYCYLLIYIYICMHVCVCMYVCVCVYIYTHECACI